MRLNTLIIARVVALALLAWSGQGCGPKSGASATKSSGQTNQPGAARATPAIKNFVANPMDDKGQRVLIRGENAVPLNKHLFSITNLLIRTERNGVEDTTIEAPHCLYNTTNGTFSSPGALSVKTSDERLTLRGRGFLFLQRDSRLIISNEVLTTLRKGTFPTKARVQNAPAPKPAGSTNSGVIQIESDQLDYQTDLAAFRGRVRATETNGRLSCDLLSVHFNPGPPIRLQRIEAEQNVVIEHGTSRASGDKATYVVGPEADVVELAGSAAWRDEQREGTANKIVLDRIRNVVRAEGQARMKLPLQGLNQPDFLVTPVGATSNPPAAGDQRVELACDLLTLNLPSTNGPIQHVEADGNVVILSPADHSRATGQRARYDEIAGTVELTGNPMWLDGDRVVKGESLVFHRADRSFSARRNAYIRIPVTALGQSALLGLRPALRQQANAATNQFIEAFADDFEYRTNRLELQRNVRAYWLEGENRNAELTCTNFQINLGQRLEGMLARGQVVARQFPLLAADGKTTSKQLTCETLSATMNAEGRLASAFAEKEVRAEQTVTQTNQMAPVVTRLSADRLSARFAPQTNQVERMVAENNVAVEHGPRSARGQHAVFDGASQILELTGQPSASAPEGRITDADALIWDVARQQLRGRGRYKSGWQQSLAKGTNALPVRLPPSR